ncbi:hypothetical protein [Nocardioides sp.]|jgi:hypothetical protein|uniref:hypothetical protein n=1 Tax=Nocardioides sp. TaxID=35761 RepID=UPI002CD1FBA2|nr:hypothetical protein [Nocardioides sp.]HSX67123.1 hypothetical protein [Nocardioides sp.]
MRTYRNDQLLLAAAQISDAADSLTGAGNRLTRIDRRIEAAANSLALAADNLMGHVLRQVAMEDLAADEPDTVDGEVVS